jgi:hypothetical protein
VSKSCFAVGTEKDPRGLIGIFIELLSKCLAAAPENKLDGSSLCAIPSQESDISHSFIVQPRYESFEKHSFGERLVVVFAYDSFLFR